MVLWVLVVVAQEPQLVVLGAVLESWPVLVLALAPVLELEPLELEPLGLGHELVLEDLAVEAVPSVAAPREPLVPVQQVD